MKADVKRSDTREKEAMDWATEFFRENIDTMKQAYPAVYRAWDEAERLFHKWTHQKGFCTATMTIAISRQT